MPRPNLDMLRDAAFIRPLHDFDLAQGNWMSEHPACETASLREGRYMTDKRNETRSTGLSYPMVELLTGTIMQLMYLNTLAVCCLLPLAVAIHAGMDEKTSE